MSSRKVSFEVGSGDKDERRDQVPSNGGPGSRFKGKHSLDSDEEDEEAEDVKKYDILATEDIEGQESATIAFDEGIKITPFNLEEEMEEGHFDSEGNYFLNREKEIRDNWLDNIDWVRIRERPERREPETEEVEGPSDVSSLLRGILEILCPGETVAGALRRLGGAVSRRRWEPSRRRRRRKGGEEEEARGGGKGAAEEGGGEKRGGEKMEGAEGEGGKVEGRETEREKGEGVEEGEESWKGTDREDKGKKAGAEREKEGGEVKGDEGEEMEVEREKEEGDETEEKAGEREGAEEDGKGRGKMEGGEETQKGGGGVEAEREKEKGVEKEGGGDEEKGGRGEVKEERGNRREKRRGEEGEEDWRRGRKRRRPAVEDSDGGAERASLERLTGLADQMVAWGEFEIYHHSYERLAHRLRKGERQGVAPPPQRPAQDVSLDMFAEQIDERALGSRDTVAKACCPVELPEVMWEYKWQNREDSEIFGPFTSEQMMAWSDQDYFGSGVYCRRVGQPPSSFYSSRRVDFELYTS